jgi:hypothetical protein
MSPGSAVQLVWPETLSGWWLEVQTTMTDHDVAVAYPIKQFLETTLLVPSPHNERSIKCHD